MRPDVFAGLAVWVLVALLVVCAAVVAIALGGLIVDAVDSVCGALR